MPTKLKLDVDGCEQHVLKGATNVLKSSTLKSAYFEDNTNDGDGIFEKFFKKEGFIITDQVALIMKYSKDLMSWSKDPSL